MEEGAGEERGRLCSSQPPTPGGVARMWEVVCLLDTEKELSLSCPVSTPPKKALRRLLSPGVGWGKSCGREWKECKLESEPPDQKIMHHAGKNGGSSGKAPQGTVMYLIHICNKESIKLQSLFNERATTQRGLQKQPENKEIQPLTTQGSLAEVRWKGRVKQ